MSNTNWKKVIRFLLKLIADGLNKNDAISKASSKFNVPKSKISGIV